MNAQPPAVEPQHLRALAYANVVRLGHAAVRREIRTGVLTAARALDDPRAHSMRLYDALKAQRQWGADRADRLLRRVVIGQRVTIGAMTSRQRQLLRDQLPTA